MGPWWQQVYTMTHLSEYEGLKNSSEWNIFKNFYRNKVMNTIYIKCALFSNIPYTKSPLLLFLNSNHLLSNGNTIKLTIFKTEVQSN